jgi:hypothetical protein
VDDVLAIASAALGSGLTKLADLGGSDRSKVLRCRDSSGGTVVVKCYPPTEEGIEGLTAEAAGLAFTTQADVGPDLLAVDQAARVIVMSDLGDAPSLADLLLGSSADEARTALLSWARAAGQLAARTAGGQHELAALRDSYAAGDPASGPGAGSPGTDHWLKRRIREVPGLLDEVAIAAPAGLRDDLTAVAGIAEPSDYDVFSPGDICPDNNLVTAAGVRFVDYESAEFHSVFVDAAYLRMPFSSCWCVFQLPADLADIAEANYRAEVSAIFTALSDDKVWLPGIRLAMAAWTLHAMTYLLDKSVIADAPMHSERRPVPTARQLLRHRWRQLRGELSTAGELPALTALLDRLLAGTDSWQVPELPGYPAFAHHR